MMDEKEMYNQTKSNIHAMMDVAMGGRAAEELIYGMEKVTTGKILKASMSQFHEKEDFRFFFFFFVVN